MRTFTNLLTLTAIATTLFEPADLIGFDDAKITADDVPVKGTAQHPATEIGQAISVIALGVDRVKASGVITRGQRVISAAGGGVKAKGAGVNDFATALTSANDGEFVDILIR